MCIVLNGIAGCNNIYAYLEMGKPWSCRRTGQLEPPRDILAMGLRAKPFLPASVSLFVPAQCQSPFIKSARTCVSRLRGGVCEWPSQVSMYSTARGLHLTDPIAKDARLAFRRTDQSSHASVDDCVSTAETYWLRADKRSRRETRRSTAMDPSTTAPTRLNITL